MDQHTMSVASATSGELDAELETLAADLFVAEMVDCWRAERIGESDLERERGARAMWDTLLPNSPIKSGCYRRALGALRAGRSTSRLVH